MNSKYEAEIQAQQGRIELGRLRRAYEADLLLPIEVLHEYNMHLLDGNHLKLPDDMSEAEYSQWLLADYMGFDLELLHKGCEQEGVELTPGSLFINGDEEEEVA